MKEMTIADKKSKSNIKKERKADQVVAMNSHNVSTTWSINHIDDKGRSDFELVLEGGWELGTCFMYSLSSTK